MSGINKGNQYDRLAQDWRQVHNIIWEIPSIAISIITGIVIVAYQPELQDWVKIALLGIGSIFMFGITVEIIKKRLLMNAISSRLYFLEKDHLKEVHQLKLFPFDTKSLLDEVNKCFEDIQQTRPEIKNPDDHDVVYLLFKWSYARQYLGYAVFVAAIMVSILTYWEFVKFLNYQWWTYWVGISPIAIISVAITILRYRAKVNEKRMNIKNKTSHFNYQQ